MTTPLRAAASLLTTRRGAADRQTSPSCLSCCGTRLELSRLTNHPLRYRSQDVALDPPRKAVSSLRLFVIHQTQELGSINTATFDKAFRELDDLALVSFQIGAGAIVAVVSERWTVFFF
jgi:hypothetical protein